MGIVPVWMNKILIKLAALTILTLTTLSLLLFSRIFWLTNRKDKFENIVYKIQEQNKQQAKKG